MVFSDLPVGATFSFGQYKASYPRNSFEPIRWIKTNDNSLSLCINSSRFLTSSFDHPYPVTGKNRYTRNYGHTFFFLSSLCKLLNCDDRSWKENSEGREPWSTMEEGFLSCFTTEERKLICPHKVSLKTPSGYSKSYGETATEELLVSIPSVQQINETFNVDNEMHNTIEGRYLRSWLIDADTMNKYYSYGRIARVNASRTETACPVIRLSDNAPVDINAEGKYIIRKIEQDFDGDLASFLGWEDSETVA